MANTAMQRMTANEYPGVGRTATERFSHDPLAGRAFAVLDAALRGKPCVAGASNVRVHSEATGMYTYPDAFVVRGPRFADARRTTLLNPRVVVEVVSLTSEAWDRGGKFKHYRTIPSIEEYVVITTTSPTIDVFTRRDGKWEMTSYDAGGEVVLASIDVKFAMDALYEGVELDPEPPLPEGTTRG